MIEQAGLLYQLPTAKLDNIEKPGTTLGLRLFKNTTTGNWYTKNSNGDIVPFVPTAGGQTLIETQYDASTNLFPAAGTGTGVSGAIMKGDSYIVSTAGTLGGNRVRIGYLLVALVNTPGQTVTNWAIIENGQTSLETIILPVGVETTALTDAGNKLTFRAPYKMRILAVRASLATAQAAGATLAFDVEINGTSIFTTPLTIDNTEKTSVTAAVPAVIGADLGLAADDNEITVDLDTIEAGSAAAGLKVTLYVAREQ